MLTVTGSGAGTTSTLRFGTREPEPRVSRLDWVCEITCECGLVSKYEPPSENVRGCGAPCRCGRFNWVEFERPKERFFTGFRINRVKELPPEDDWIYDKLRTMHYWLPPTTHWLPPNTVEPQWFPVEGISRPMNLLDEREHVTQAELDTLVAEEAQGRTGQRRVPPGVELVGKVAEASYRSAVESAGVNPGVRRGTITYGRKDRGR